MKHKKKVTFAHIMRDVGHAVRPVTKEIGHIANKVVSMPEHIVDKGAGVLNNMSLPLLVIGGAVAIYMINKN